MLSVRVYIVSHQIYIEPCVLRYVQTSPHPFLVKGAHCIDTLISTTLVDVLFLLFLLSVCYRTIYLYISIYILLYAQHRFHNGRRLFACVHVKAALGCLTACMQPHIAWASSWVGGWQVVLTRH